MRKRKGINWFAVLMLMVVGYFLTVLTTQQLHLSHVSESQYLADKRLEAAKHENDKLKKQYEELQDVSNIERLAREDLGLAKQGELPYQTAR
ncbi:MAG: septum formation initiator family protein [Selenomonadaceae bacterium]|nr:septum formation initiator family protein [Selenomonadaceae bacterium]MBR1579578.1 septum formation initiator family protein [Selenomonadaceae bacterium]